MNVLPEKMLKGIEPSLSTKIGNLKKIEKKNNYWYKMGCATGFSMQ